MAQELYTKALDLLQSLISISSFSKEESGTADTIDAFLKKENIVTNRLVNNIWAVNQYFEPGKPIVLLNSHHDTVKPNPKYTRDPFAPAIENEKLFGLGSNDAGGCLVSLILTFVHFYKQENLPFNLVLAATAEEEISGKNGIELLLHDPVFQALGGRIIFDNWKNWQAIVGEPTQLELAVAEKGLMVLDAVANGVAGHAARNEGDNAIYKAVKDIEWFRTFQFPRESEWLGKVKMTVTSIFTENKAHNVVPATCNYIVDIRITDAYTHEEVLDIVRSHVQSEVNARSFRLRSSRIDKNNFLVQSGIALGKKAFGSPTSSDKALMPFPAVKCGPGDSARSHTADEFIYLQEIKDGIDFYTGLLHNSCLG